MAAVLISVIAGLAAGQQDSFLHINRPKNLADVYPNGVDETPAMFGIPAYGHGASISGVVVYSVPNDLNACEKIDKSRAVAPWPSSGAVIVMVDRGNCTFVTKVRHAEEVGAHACIVVDNRDEPYLPFMADDGTGSSISIPSVLIHKNDGLILKKFVANSTVVVTLGWNLPNPDNIAEWEFWTSSWDPTGQTFKKQFKPVATSLADSAPMTPRYIIQAGETRGCTSADLPCDRECSNSGRYCSTDPDGDPLTGLSGIDVVQEDLRQLCMWDVLNASRTGTLWWDYVTAFQAQCGKPSTWGKACSERVMASLRIDLNRVQACVMASGGSDFNGPINSRLEKELADREGHGVFFTPTVQVQGASYWGSLACPPPYEQAHCGVLKELCAGFQEEKLPVACTPCGFSRKIDGCGVCLEPTSKLFNRSCAGCDGIPNSNAVVDNCSVCNGPGRDKCGNCFALGDPRRVTGDGQCPTAQAVFPLYGVVLLVLACVFFVGGGVYWYMKRQQRAMRGDIDALLKQYLPLSESNPNVPAGPASATAV